MSGPFQLYAGPQAVTAVRMAVEDFGGSVLGRPVEVVSGDHQNKADLGSSLARQWMSQGFPAIINMQNSSVALAVNALLRDAKSCIGLFTAPATPRLTNEDCTPFTAHWVFDTNMFSNVVGKTLIARGADSWYFLTMDIASGHSLEKSVSDAVLASGGKVLGAVRHPLGTSEFSSYLLNAQASRAKVIALANAGTDTVQCVKTAKEFGITQPGSGQEVVALSAVLDDIHALGLAEAQGLIVTEAFYWDRNEESRVWAKRFAARAPGGFMPNMVRAGDYSAALHWLRSVQDAGTTEPAAVMPAMRARPVNDVFAQNGKLRPDGLMVHDMFLFRVKKPSESRGPWDYYELTATIPGEQAFQSLAAGRCPLVKS